MWIRFARTLRCPQCAHALALSIFTEAKATLDAAHLEAAEQRSLRDADFDRYVETGLLTCEPCHAMYPIVQGLPVMLPYTTMLHEHFLGEHRARIGAVANGYRFPMRDPVQGETFVLRSFSTEWLAYAYDGVIWEMDYADHERRFLAEIDGCRPTRSDGSFLELGCGIGITTDLAQKNFGGDAVGVDLSLAALRAAARFRDNPFLHFVQGSVFYLPFAQASFDTIYSRGVLHHTFSTEKAFRSLARYAKPGGALYLWVYGPKSINDNAFRRGVYVAERIVRGLVSRQKSATLATAVLAPLAVGYVVFNRARRAADPTIQPYDYRRALHAARDRFTPEFAHRHDHDTVMRWFAEAGFERVEVVDWRAMPTADHDDYRRNTGVRGRMRGAGG